ncbi:ankyrin repeat and protein kinase domain-containing protein 1-like [Montipora capricornis]|uniref:ankyrin repeat and protein kinase domain-containing protein 1-like n=1 Tax=Montipora capricornis TaxID=246305 RepID=UPI0035F1FF8C
MPRIPSRRLKKAKEERSLRSIFKRFQYDTEHSTDQRFLNSQLRTAVSAGAEPVEIRNLLLRGAEVNCIDSLGYTPLLLALVASDSEYLITTVELLCQFGADVNYSSDLLFRDTPLHFTAALGNDEIIELLFRHKADVHARNHAGYTPLHVAAHNGSEASVTALFLCGADLNCTENYCWYTPLHLAVIGQFETVVKALVLSGARINQADSSNLTPLNRCQSKSIRSILLGALNPGCSSLESSCLAVIRGAVRKVIGIYGFDKLPLPIALRRKLRLKS